MTERASSKNWFIKHKVLSVIVALFVFGFIVATTSNNKTPTTTDSSTNASDKTSTAQTSTQPQNNTPAKPAQRQVRGTATTLGAGSFTGGKDVAVGLYDVTAPGQSGNFSVSGTDEYNEILGTDQSMSEVPKVRVQISNGDQISISGLSNVIFTPVTTSFSTLHTTTNLYAGTFTVGQDIGAGRYVVTPGAGQSGNFSTTGSNDYNEILGSDKSLGEVPSVTVSLVNGDVIALSGMSQVAFTPVN